MGTFALRATLENPEDRRTSILLEMLVDTGATWSLVSSDVARSLGVDPFRLRKYHRRHVLPRGPRSDVIAEDWSSHCRHDASTLDISMPQA